MSIQDYRIDHQFDKDSTNTELPNTELAPEYKTYIERNGEVIEVFTLEQSFNNAIENDITYHKWKLENCESVKDYNSAVYHQNVIGALEHALIVFNGIVREKAKESKTK